MEMLRRMTAAPHFFDEPPPVCSPVEGHARPLGVLPGGDLEQRLADAERLTLENHHDAALELLDELWPETRIFPVLACRHLLAAAWAQMYRGQLEEAAGLLAHADAIVQAPLFDAGDRAEVLFRRGCVTLKRGEVADATALFTRTLETNARSARPSTLLAAHVLDWRSRCHQLRRDWDAAGRDAEASLELADSVSNDRARANALFQSSLIAERQRQWLLARYYAEQALELYIEQNDTLSRARILNNLGGLQFLLGNIAGAERALAEAAATATEAGSDADVAQATSSLAQVMLHTDRPLEARSCALNAIDLLAGRDDFRDELGNAELVVAQSFTAEHETPSAIAWLDRAEHTFAGPESSSQLAAVWMARGDLAGADGDHTSAAELYRRAAEALQDFHF
jgi:tetratricopeptide (TPR) repeat protein